QSSAFRPIGISTPYYKSPRTRVLDKTKPRRSGALPVQLRKRQLFVRGSVGIGGAIFSAGTFWSMGGIVVRGAAGAGTIGEAGGLTEGAPWPVVVGAGLLAVVLGMVMAKA